MYLKYEKLRDGAGVTDYEVAKRTGVATPTLTNWKYGRYEPKIDKLLALANYFNVPVGYFLEGKGDEPNERNAEVKNN